MRTFKFQNQSATHIVEIETDLVGANNDNLTIHDINFVKGDQDDMIALGMFDQFLPETKQGFITYASTNNFTLDEIDVPSNSTTNRNTATALAITTTSIDAGNQGVAFSYQLEDEGGNGKITYSIESGTLVDGLTLSATGLISGTPTATGTPSITFKVTDQLGVEATKELTVTINA